MLHYITYRFYRRERKSGTSFRFAIMFLIVVKLHPVLLKSVITASCDLTLCVRSLIGLSAFFGLPSREAEAYTKE
jgi:hypothetical protein